MISENTRMTVWVFSGGKSGIAVVWVKFRSQTVSLGRSGKLLNLRVNIPLGKRDGRGIKSFLSK
jgi:hypothetical protein